MTDHDADVVAVLARRSCSVPVYQHPSQSYLCNHPSCILAALTAANYAVVKLPKKKKRNPDPDYRSL